MAGGPPGRAPIPAPKPVPCEAGRVGGGDSLGVGAG
jgi:hypothetical protein